MLYLKFIKVKNVMIKSSLKRKQNKKIHSNNYSKQ